MIDVLCVYHHYDTTNHCQSRKTTGSVYYDQLARLLRVNVLRERDGTTFVDKNRIRKMEQGTIKRITDKGFGFIAPADNNGKDMFFHSSAVSGVEFNDLREGQEVTYTVGQGPKGPRAENVQLAGN